MAFSALRSEEACDQGRESAKRGLKEREAPAVLGGMAGQEGAFPFGRASLGAVLHDARQ